MNIIQKQECDDCGKIEELDSQSPGMASSYPEGWVHIAIGIPRPKIVGTKDLEPSQLMRRKQFRTASRAARPMHAHIDLCKECAIKHRPIIALAEKVEADSPGFDIDY